MALIFQQVKQFSDFDFDNLFLESIIGINRNLFNPTLTTFEERKAFFRFQLDRAIDGTCPLQNPGETLFMYKISKDGKDIFFKAGYIEVDGITHRGHWFLTARDLENNKNWLYTEELDVKQREFCALFGVTQHKVLCSTDSPMYKMVHARTKYTKDNNLPGRPEIIFEEPDPLESQNGELFKHLTYVIITVKL